MMKEEMLGGLGNPTYRQYAADIHASGGTITVSAKRNDQGGVAIAVKDTGFGIAPEEQAQLFQPFSRAPDAERRHIEGTGLGLALVKSLMDLHGGTVMLDSAPGKGSIFTVCFPVSDLTS